MMVYEKLIYSRTRSFLYIESFVLFITFCPIYGGKMWYVLNVVQCWPKLIPIYMIYAALDVSF